MVNIFIFFFFFLLKYNILQLLSFTVLKNQNQNYKKFILSIIGNHYIKFKFNS